MTVMPDIVDDLDSRFLESLRRLWSIGWPSKNPVVRTARDIAVEIGAALTIFGTVFPATEPIHRRKAICVALAEWRSAGILRSQTPRQTATYPLMMLIRRNPLRDPVFWVRIGLALLVALFLAILCYVMFHGLPNRPVY